MIMMETMGKQGIPSGTVVVHLLITELIQGAEGQCDDCKAGSLEARYRVI